MKAKPMRYDGRRGGEERKITKRYLGDGRCRVGSGGSVDSGQVGGGSAHAPHAPHQSPPPRNDGGQRPHELCREKA